MADKTYVSDYDGTMVRTTDNRYVSVYKDGPVPSNADPGHVKILLDRKMIHEGKPTGGVTAVGDPDSPPFTPPPSGSSAPRQSSYDGTSAPAKSGSKGAWLDWASKVEGVAPDSDEAKSLGEMTRDELADTYADRTPAPAGA
jgi:hypothetical protein